MSKHWRFAAKLFVDHVRFMMCKAQRICWIFLTGLTATATATAFRSYLCLINVLLGAITIFVCSTQFVILHFSASTKKNINDDLNGGLFITHCIFSKAIELHQLHVNKSNNNASHRNVMPPKAAIQATSPPMTSIHQKLVFFTMFL